MTSVVDHIRPHVSHDILHLTYHTIFVVIVHICTYVQITCTVKPVYKDHSKDSKMWPLKTDLYRGASL